MTTNRLKHNVFGVSVGCIGLIVAGCAAIKNTPAQDRTWAANAVCRDTVSTNIRIQRVDADGRWYWTAPAIGRDEFYACMERELRKQR
jgi:hypothetical protein